MDNKDKQPTLDGFAPAVGSGGGAGAGVGGGSSSIAVASKSKTADGVGTTTIAAGGGGGAGSNAAAEAKKPARTTKKRASKKGAGAAGTSAENNDSKQVDETVIRSLPTIGPDFEPMTLPQIQLRLKSLVEKLPQDLPAVPPDHEPVDDNLQLYSPIKDFASALQTTIEEYNLLLSLVSSATYKWGVDRSGASQQNLSVMSAELQQCQDVISNVVSARLSNVLCPAVDVMIGEVEIVKASQDNSIGEEGEKVPSKKRKLNEDRLANNTSTNNTQNERRINHYTRPLVDPGYVHLCHCILARNAPLIRHTVATSIHTAQRVIGDYLNAMKKDSSHEAGKGGYY